VAPPGGEDIVCLAASPHSLWVLDTAGRVMIRQGLCDANPMGHGWRELDLAQISKCKGNVKTWPEVTVHDSQLVFLFADQ
jgi:hypothetical protein